MFEIRICIKRGDKIDVASKNCNLFQSKMTQFPKEKEIKNRRKSTD